MIHNTNIPPRKDMLQFQQWKELSWKTTLRQFHFTKYHKYVGDKEVIIMAEL